MRRYAVTMPREKPVPQQQFLDTGVTVSLFHTSQGWWIQVFPVGRNAQEKLRPRWVANYKLPKSSLPREPTVRDGILSLAESACLAVDGWLEHAMINGPF
jgi:hypothetical protein